MKTRNFLVIFLVIVLMLTTMCCVHAEEKEEKLGSQYYYTILPMTEVKTNYDATQFNGLLPAGTIIEEVYGIRGAWANVRFLGVDGQYYEGWVQKGAIAPAVRITVKLGTKVYHKPTLNYGYKDMGTLVAFYDMIIMTDGSAVETEESYTLLILRKFINEDGEEWLYVLTLPDCRAGYMEAITPYTIVDGLYYMD